MEFVSLLLYVCVMCFTPGPNNLMSMYVSVKNRLTKASPFLFGALAGYTSLFALCGLLNLLLAYLVPAVEPFMKWLGVAFMLYLAVTILLSRREASGESAKPFSFLMGFALQYVNVKGWLFGLTVFSTYVTPYFRSVLVILGFALGFSVVTFAASLSWAVFGNVFKSFYDRHFTAFNIFMAVLLVCCAVSVML
jgi:threonine/homoserine/homoserine lactone efflux protein